MHQEKGRKKLIVWGSMALIVVVSITCLIWFASKGVASGAMSPEISEITVCETTSITSITTTSQTTTKKVTTVTTTTETTKETTTTTEYDGKSYPDSKTEINMSSPDELTYLSDEWNWYWALHFNVGWPVEGEYLGGRKGRSTAPNGFSETYYNMEMSGIVEWMRSLGFSEEEYPYWIHPVMGTKMLGPYIIVAGDLPAKDNPDPIYQRGDITECSLGAAIVCDCGGFMYENPQHYDIAVNWTDADIHRYPGFSDLE